MNKPDSTESGLKHLPSPVHLMGIGGAGVSSLAEYLAGAGMRVTGCDSTASRRLHTLERAGIGTVIGHDPSHINANLRSVVYSAAVSRYHPELIAAREAGIKTIPRSLALARISRVKTAFCIAGSHGKSTVSALITHIITSAGYDPGFIIGAVSRETGTGGHYGSGRLLILETDEFDRTLELVCPSIGVITNVESEHLDVYGTMKRLHASFMRFLRRAANRNGAVIWTDKPGGLSPPDISGTVLRCGFHEKNHCNGTIIKSDKKTIHAVIKLFKRKFEITLPLTGTHNLMNAILAAGASHLNGIAFHDIAGSFSSFKGLERRFECIGIAGRTEFFSDYAHHPTEIRAVLETARRLGRPVVAVFQPHLYSRTASMFGEFAEALSQADDVIVTGIYPAREKPIPGVTGKLISDTMSAMGTSARYTESFEELEIELDQILGSDVTVLFLAAGDLDWFAREFLSSRL